MLISGKDHYINSRNIKTLRITEMSSKVIILLSVVAAVSATKPYIGYPLPFYPKYTAPSEIVKSGYGYQVSLQWGIDDLTHFCSGAILNSTWVITTARCASVVPPYGNFVVEVGKHNLKDIESTQQTIRVQSSILHELYKGNAGFYDLALLKLDSPITLNSAVKEIALSEEQVRSGSAEMLSWGSTWRTYRPFTLDQLQMTKLNLISNSVCIDILQNITGSNQAPGERQLCGVSESRAFSTCESEPGAPLIRYRGSEPTLLGLATWGVMPCGTPGSPLVFEHVAYFTDWVASKLKSN